MERLAVTTIVLLMILSLVGGASSSGNSGGTKKAISWVAPDSAGELANPLARNVKSAIAGQKLFAVQCVICHGSKGKGDGLGGINLKPKPTDLTIESVQDQTDGALFWKLTEGRPPMASYKAVLSEQQRWELVTYIRQLKPKKKKK